jgi:2-polyprenyl-3-methyl-5-hydroxy-6-metoxy-1,4-benzoquinol methylase
MRNTRSLPRVTKGDLPSPKELEELFVQKYGSPATTGWAPKQRFRFRYYLPADVYESVVSRHVTEGCNWLDVGGGQAIFPENPDLARALVSRCARAVAVDPSVNVHKNKFVHETVCSTLEEYKPNFQFDLATVRMVVEHVSDPEGFVGALARLVRSGGVVIVLTVNLWSPITILSRLLPFELHHPLKRRFWGGKAEDTFPVHYRMNTRQTLRRLFERSGFTEDVFARQDDLSLLGQFPLLSHAELLVWRGLTMLGLGYPENCLLGLYRRRMGESSQSQGQ